MLRPEIDVEGTPLEIHEHNLTAFHKKYIVNGTTQPVSNVQLDESKEEFKAPLNIIDRIGTRSLADTKERERRERYSQSAQSTPAV